jgi:hypothetical protein
MYSLALVPLDKVDEYFKRVEEVSNNLVDEKKNKINVTSILKYFKSTWMDRRWKKEHWNYYDYLGRRTNNDLEGFNRQLNRFLHSPHPNIYKFVDHIKGIDQKNSLRIIEYRKNPIDYGKWSLPSKQVEKETKLQRLMAAYKNDQISLFDYLNALASNIEVTQFIDDDFVVDYEEVEIEVEEEAFNSTIQEIEDMSLLNNAQDTSAYLRELEEDGESEI